MDATEMPEHAGSKANAVDRVTAAATAAVGVLTTLVTVVVVLACVVVWRFYPHTLSFAAVPLGALVAGALCSSGVVLAVRIARTRVRLWHGLASICLGTVGFAGVYCGLYAVAYMGPDMRVNHLFEGEHISHFVRADGHKQIGFEDYLLGEVANRRMIHFAVIGSIRRPTPILLGKLAMVSISNWAAFGLEWLGFAVGGLPLLWLRRVCTPAGNEPTPQAAG